MSAPALRAIRNSSLQFLRIIERTARLFYTTPRDRTHPACIVPGINTSPGKLILSGRGLRRHWRLRFVRYGHLLARDAVLFVYPGTQIHHLAALGAKRPIQIIFPSGGFTAGGTRHCQESTSTQVNASGSHGAASAAGRFTRIFLLTKSIVPSRRIAFKRTVTLSRVEPIRCDKGISMRTPRSSSNP